MALAIDVVTNSPLQEYTWSVAWVDSAGATSPPATAQFSTAIMTLGGAATGTRSSAGSPDWQGAAWLYGNFEICLTDYSALHRTRRVISTVHTLRSVLLLVVWH